MFVESLLRRTSMAQRHVAAVVLLALAAVAGCAQAFPPPVECSPGAGCSVVNYFREWADRQPCRFRKAIYPKTERHLIAAVAQAVRSKSRVRVVSKGSHSFPKLACPGGATGVLISTRDLDRLVHVDARARTVTVDAGVMLRELVQVLAEHTLALPHAPVWSGLSVAGLIGTGAHGSSLWGKGGAVHDYVASVRVVVPASAAAGYARVRTFSAANRQEMAAVRVHLGVLGAISQVTLRVQPQFKRSVTYQVTSDAQLESRLLTLARENEFAEVMWYPAQKLARYRMDNRVPVSTPGDGVLQGFPPLVAQNLMAARAAELVTERTRNESAQCAQAAGVLHYLEAMGFGLANNRSAPGVFQGYPVVGLSHEIMTSSGCWDGGPEENVDPTSPLAQVCLWDLGPEGTFVFNNGVSVALSQVGALVRDMRRLADLRPLALCGLEQYGGIWMRFLKGGSSAYLGAGREDAVDLDFNFRRAADARTPLLNQDVMDEVEQMAVLKYGGRPHWGKGRPVTFTGVGRRLYPRLHAFLRVREKLDPEGLFSNEWTDAVLGVRGSVSQVRPYCALEGLCICSRDVHCAPEAGYYCRPGLVYKQARVCRFEAAHDHMHAS